MALNKYMHPRNIYKSPPDFAKLAASYEDFSSIVKKDVTGKVSIDFKDPHSLRVLTKCLLKSDFNLDVLIPDDRLVPTLPLRLNYILWIEDLLGAIQKTEGVQGLDIGTGACAIYPLLAAVKNKWHMIGTETDEQSLLKAQENVQRNNLQKLIELKKNSTTSLMKHLLDGKDELKFDFSMCNPPFYRNIQELCESRSPARVPPKNGFTGSPQELITAGGELAFCRKMIEESKEYQDKVLMFTTMVGHKYSLKELELDLKAEGIRNTTTEFCQGRVTRWGLAWTYQDYDISELVPARDKPRKKNVPITYTLPEIAGTPNNMDIASKKIKSICQDLKVDYKILNKRGNNILMDIKAMTNTWSNQRRKRRLMKKLQSNDVKKPRLDSEEDGKCNKVLGIYSTIPSDIVNPIGSIETGKPKDIEKMKVDIEVFNTKKNSSSKSPTKSNDDTDTVNFIHNEDVVKNSEVRNEENTYNTSDSTCFSRNITTIHSSDPNDSISESSEANTSVESEAVAHAFLRIVKKENTIHLEMEFLDGTAGKAGLHQIVQYIKNNWK